MTAPSVDVLLTRFRRNTLRRQLSRFSDQSLKPTTLTVFQNTLHYRLPSRRLQHKSISSVINSDNTGHFGRFAYALNLKSDFIAVVDDDIMPGRNCLESYVSQAREFEAIVGGNGRIAEGNPHRAQLYQPPDVGIREAPVLVDFVGHMWVFRREWLFDMWAISPKTMATAEDMHLCFSAKLRSAVPAIVAAQTSTDELSDVALNKFAVDRHASHLQVSHGLRPQVEEYFSVLGLEFITPDDAEAFVSRGADGGRPGAADVHSEPRK